MLTISGRDITNLATIRTPAYSKYYAECNSLGDMEEVSQFSKSNKLKLQIIGNGTNILFSKELYIDIMFLKLGKGFNFIDFSEDKVEIGGSYSFMRAGKKLTDFGYEDFIYMALIPGSLGGGIRQNAGTTKEGEVKDNFISAKVYDLLEKKIKTFDREEMKFSYRNSIIQKEPNRYIVLSAIFHLGKKANDVKDLFAFVQEKKKAKKEKEPFGYSFGSTFKNLEQPAWKYLSIVNMCDKEVGGAKFSDKHCNWIINFKDASGDDVVQLINSAKSKVYNTLHVKLCEEVEII